jgi:hypothetical protein
MAILVIRPPSVMEVAASIRIQFLPFEPEIIRQLVEMCGYSGRIFCRTGRGDSSDWLFDLPDHFHTAARWHRVCHNQSGLRRGEAIESGAQGHGIIPPGDSLGARALRAFPCTRARNNPIEKNDTSGNMFVQIPASGYTVAFQMARKHYGSIR